MKGSERLLFKKKRVPIVFIPGILGSMGEGILGGSGDLEFGMAEEIYRPIIENLEDLGYVENKDLFICYYNWTKRNMNSVKEYLIPMIKRAKKISKSPYVDIISHSMGGLVARTYVQGRLYKNDINKLIMIATPNLGSANAYYFWSGGEVLSRNKYKNVLYKMIIKMYVIYARFKYDEDIGMEFIRREVPSVKELLPSIQYGNYLLLENTKTYLPIEDMNIQNEFLNKLNENKDIIKQRNIRLYSIIGEDTDTIHKIKVREQDENKDRWEDGKPRGKIETLKGDGTVLCKSAVAIDGRRVYINSNHTDILSDSSVELARMLNVRKRHRPNKVRKERCHIIYGIIAKDIKGINISGDLASYRILSKEENEDLSWFLIESNQEKNISIKVASLSNASELIVYKGNEIKGSIEEKNIDVKNIGIKSIEL